MNNPKKVIDGLQCCIAQNRYDCRGCLYHSLDGRYRSCIRDLMIDALDTIESLQRKIEHTALTEDEKEYLDVIKRVLAGEIFSYGAAGIKIFNSEWFIKHYRYIPIRRGGNDDKR